MTGGAAAGLVLAAGAGRRFGRPKALVELDGERLVDRVVRTLRAGGCATVTVVAGAVPLDGVDATVVTNPDWGTGMGSSLRAGLAALPTTCSGASVAVVLLVDTPLVGPEAVRRLVSAYVAGASVAVATYGGSRGHPVLLAREHWAEVSRLATDDNGARAFLLAHPDLVVAVPCDGTGDPADVDTRADLAHVASQGQRSP